MTISGRALRFSGAYSVSQFKTIRYRTQDREDGFSLRSLYLLCVLCVRTAAAVRGNLGRAVKLYGFGQAFHGRQTGGQRKDNQMAGARLFITVERFSQLCSGSG